MLSDVMEFPRIMVGALRGGSGKTILAIGIIAALCRQGKSVAPFKKGPDYIDSGWLALAAGRPCYNLDSFLLDDAANLQSFISHAVASDFAVIEGNRGLYDGIDLEGSTSTAELAKLLKSPVVLCVDCTKATRTMAAVVSGCIRFDPHVTIKAVILNRVAHSRHEQKLRDSIEYYCGIPVIGALPKLGKQYFPERHLGLVPTPEHNWAKDSIGAVMQIAEQYVDLKAVVEIARDAPPLSLSDHQGGPEVIRRKTAGAGRAEIAVSAAQSPKPRIGILKDAAFQFYYPENIDALAANGADIVFLSPLKNPNLPELDALYIGGGFPETHAQQLAANQSFSRQLRVRAEAGLPIYAECGGLMYLGEALILEGKTYPMAGVLPVVFGFYKRPQGHGYTLVTVEKQNPYFDVGMELRGHEFHYSQVANWSGNDEDLVFRMQRGAGIHRDRDGILFKNVLATYTHIHARGTPGWAKAFVHNAIQFKKSCR
jgi:cobyrinic acid a,c-diamide synthase